MLTQCPQTFTVADLITLLEGANVSAPITFQTEWGANLKIRHLKTLSDGKITILMSDEREEEIDEFAKQLVVNLQVDSIAPQFLDN